MPNLPSVSPAGAVTADVEALIARVAELEHSQLSEDVDGFLALFDPQAVWVTGGGRRLIALDVIAEFTRSVLPGAMVNSTVRYTVEHILFITPDVALTGVRQQYFDRAGAPLPAVGLPSYVWRRGPAGWQIVTGQNTVSAGV